MRKRCLNGMAAADKVGKIVFVAHISRSMTMRFELLVSSWRMFKHIA